MLDFLKLFVHILASSFKSQARLEAEIVVLRQQLMVLRRRSPSKPKLTVADRLLFVWLYRLFPSVLNAITIIQPETVMRWLREPSDRAVSRVDLSPASCAFIAPVMALATAQAEKVSGAMSL
jgi:hypothetical protein